MPICASCKSIRDDHGYWRRIEGDIGERSEAEFSLGVCPPRAEKLYASLDDDDPPGDGAGGQPSGICFSRRNSRYLQNFYGLLTKSDLKS